MPSNTYSFLVPRPGQNLTRRQYRRWLRMQSKIARLERYQVWTRDQFNEHQRLDDSMRERMREVQRSHDELQRSHDELQCSHDTYAVSCLFFERPDFC